MLRNHRLTPWGLAGCPWAVARRLLVGAALAEDRWRLLAAIPEPALAGPVGLGSVTGLRPTGREREMMLHEEQEVAGQRQRVQELLLA
jgi:hypothetical protein